MKTRSAHYRRLAGLILGMTLGFSLAVLLVGYIYHWDEPVLFSNAFYAAGVIVILLGGLSVAGGFSQRANFGMIYAESAGQADQAERSRRTIREVTQRYGVMILLLIPGLILIGIAMAISKFLVQ